LFDYRTQVRLSTIFQQPVWTVNGLNAPAGMNRPNTPDPQPISGAKGEPDKESPDKEFMATLAKGLAVLKAFGETRPSMTLTEAAAEVGLSRATARRILRTLAELGYVEQEGRAFVLTPRVLELGFRYLSTQSWIDRALPLMKSVSEDLQESCSAAILQGLEVVYVARVPTRRIMMSSISVGTRLPALYTSLGRAQLGFLSDEELWARLRSKRLEANTPSSITDVRALFERIREDHARGFSIVDEELERGLRSIAVPLVGRSGRVVAAFNVSAHSNRTTRNEMRDQFLPRLLELADQVSIFA
jgi:IclR family pca regulon transcriptional regulator